MCGGVIADMTGEYSCDAMATTPIRELRLLVNLCVTMRACAKGFNSNRYCPSVSLFVCQFVR